MKLLSLTTVVASLLTGALARSSVHVVSNNANELASKPEISINAFSMFYSHMTGSSSNHPVLQLQTNDAIEDLLPQSNNLFEQKTDASLVVIVAGANNPEDILSSYDSTFYVNNDNPDSYAAIAEQVTDDTSLTTYKNLKTEIKKGDFVSETSYEASVDDFKQDFAEFNTDLFNANKQADKDFMTEVETIRELSQTEDFDVTVIQINTLQKIGKEYGVESDEYKEAQAILKDLFEKHVIPNFQQLYSRGVSTFILTPYTSQNLKRAVPELVTEEGTCFTSAKACQNGTSHCSGNGQCVLIGESCYACQCKSSSFVGDSCQYVDAVNDFQLLFWTSVLLIVVTTSVVVCVYQSGSDAEGAIIMTQSAPKQD